MISQVAHLSTFVSDYILKHWWYYVMTIDIIILYWNSAADPCRNGNNIYSVGETYIGGNCSTNCTCFKGGIIICQPLCPVSFTLSPFTNLFGLCGARETSQIYREQITGTNCSCEKRRCVAGKSILINYCFFLDHFRFAITPYIRKKFKENLYGIQNVAFPNVSTIISILLTAILPVR